MVEVSQSVIDQFKAAVADVVSEIAAAVDALRNHPAAQNDDGALSGLADQLATASSTLAAAVPPAAPASADTAAASSGSDPAAGAGAAAATAEGASADPGAVAPNPAEPTGTGAAQQ